MKINRPYFFLAVSLLAVIILGSFSTACAADADRWTGVYAGVNVGYGMGKPTTSFMPMKRDSGGTILPNPGTALGDFQDLLPQQLHPSANGIVGGGQFGFNVQLKRFVIGAEADIQGTSMDGSKTVTPIIRADGSTFSAATDAFLKASQHTSWVTTFRPRLGLALSPKFLAYATGGLAYGSVDTNVDTNYGTGMNRYPFASNGKNKTGYTVGAGLEYKCSKRISLKGEYLFYDLGTKRVIAPAESGWEPFFVGYGVATKAHIIRAGLNFRIK